MHLEKDILKGKFGNSKKLKREAVDELKETKKGAEWLRRTKSKVLRMRTK